MQLTKEECREVLEVFDMHLEGVADAKESITEDPTLESYEALTETLGDLHEHETTIKRVREKIFREYRRRDFACTLRSLLSDLQAYVRTGETGEGRHGS